MLLEWEGAATGLRAWHFAPEQRGSQCATNCTV